MKKGFVYILDYTIGECMVFELTEDELKKSESYDDFEDFLVTLEDKYGFTLSNSSWMYSENLSTTITLVNKGTREITKFSK